MPGAPTKPGAAGAAAKTPLGGPAKAPGALPAAPVGPLVPSRKPVRDPNVPLGETKIVEPIEQASLKGSELAALYRKYTGRRVIVSAAAAAAEFAFVQDASAEDPLTYAQAAELLKKAAGIENFVFMPDDKDANLDFLTVAARLPGIGYDVLNENDPLPEGEGVVSYVMTFKHIKPETAAQAFTQIIGTFGTYGSIAPLNGSVVITENTSLIRRLIKLKEEIDKPADVTSTRFISVKYADVTELAGTLNDLLNTQQQAQKTTAVQRAGAPAAPAVPGAPPQNTPAMGGAAATSTDTPVQIIPEPRTNRIFAMGRPVDLLFVEGLIREFDIETSEKTFLRRKLKFLTVSDFLPIASDALNRAFTSSGDSGGAGGAANRSSNRGGSRSGSNTGGTGGSGGSGGTGSSGRSASSSGNSSFGGGNSSFGGMGGSSGGMGGGGGKSGGGGSLSNPNATSAPESRLVGRTLLVADNITNSIVVQGPPSGLEIIQRLLDQVDVKADQVMISTVIGQLSLSKSNEFGVGYMFNSKNFQGGGGGGLPSFKPALATGTAATLTNTFPQLDLSQVASPGLRLYGTAGDLSVFLKAIESQSDFTVLARPSIFTANNQKGIISSGERVAIPTGTNTYGAGASGNVSTQIQYQDVVLKLEVIPLINSENEITLQIALLNDEVTGTQSIAGGAGAEPLVVPRITTREILTTVTIPNKQTIVLGGLITGRKGTTVTGIPILGSIPILGKLFSSNVKTDDRAELLVFLQPSIVTSRSTLDDAQSDMDRRYKVSKNLRKFSDGPEDLPPPNPAIPFSTNRCPPKAIPVEPAPAPAPAKASVKTAAKPTVKTAPPAKSSAKTPAKKPSTPASD